MATTTSSFVEFHDFHFQKEIEGIPAQLVSSPEARSQEDQQYLFTNK